MTLKSQVSTASGIVGAFKQYKSAIDVLQMLEDELGVTATIDATQLACRYGKIKKELHRLNPDATAAMKRFQQIGILDKGCPLHPGIGYVRPGSLVSLLGDSPAPPESEIIGAAERLPSHLRLAAGAIREELLQKMSGFLSFGFDPSSLKLYYAVNKVKLPAKQGLIPKGSHEMKGNWALFLREKASDGKWEYVLHVLWVKKTSRDAKRTQALTTAMAELHLYGEIETQMERRESGGKMRVFGHRWSNQFNGYGENYGLHTHEGVVRKAEEAVGSILMSLVVDILSKSCFMGTLLQSVESALQYGGTVWHQKWAFTLGSVTRNYNIDPHTDGQDLLGSIIVWLDDYPNGEGSIKNGYFVMSTHGVHAVPDHTSAVYVRIDLIEHYSTAPETTCGAGRLGIALAARKNVITGTRGVCDAIYDALRDAEGDMLIPLITSEEDITLEWRERPGVAACLQMIENGKLIPEKNNKKNTDKYSLKKRQTQKKKNPPKKHRKINNKKMKWINYNAEDK